MQEDDFPEDATRPSKTKQKEAMHELRDLGAELVELPAAGSRRGTSNSTGNPESSADSSGARVPPRPSAGSDPC